MKFGVMERMILLKSLAGVEGNLATLRVVRDLQNELSFSEEEHKELGFRQEGTQVRWDPSNVSLKEVSIGPAALEAALFMFQQQDEAQKLTLENLPLYERLLKEKHEATSPTKLAAV